MTSRTRTATHIPRTAAVLSWNEFVEPVDPLILVVGYGLTCVGITVGFHPPSRLNDRIRFRERHPYAGSVRAPVTDDVPLELIKTRTFGSRVIYERYRRIRDDSD